MFAAGVQTQRPRQQQDRGGGHHQCPGQAERGQTEPRPKQQWSQGDD